MAETSDLQIEDGTEKKDGGMMPVILAFVVVTLIGGGGGAAMGFLLGGGSGDKQPEVVVAEPVPEAKAEAKADGEAAASGDHAETIKEIAEEEVKPLQVVALKPVLTNLYNPSTSWIRIEASIILKQDDEIDPLILAAEIEADTLAFARSLQIAQVEGTRGLLHLRDDLRERARLRSENVVDYLIQAMVVE
ncbi:flagellar basal body-associated FliL family protein [Fulvimarina sp. 2208YS6-2-32]|uniref:Flagellar basal body-associated FliL family protein n=1 Tax=Fulvimarina uroteuthidis TaxID=3098149 RepID=A0ABU5I1N3_9HYPH|nr:flagellar basal body-associated FliL family protein [Fulvimarina sp. 2208YS6-2-32]MDY8108081.1 flagellar basal body-associated FliL family protein [Fulvimarina sp. 2208YS6-2-32]